MTLFTVIIPCYNAAATLRETLESLRAQTLEDWEAVLVDDGSSDETPAMIAAICANDRRFRALSLRNGGPSVARNRAARIARGRYLAFLDADDLWTPEKLAETAAAFRMPPTAGAVFGRIGFFHEADQPDHTQSTVKGGLVTIEDVLGENPACTLSNLSVRRDVFDALGGFNETFRYAEDLEFQLRLVGTGAGLRGLDSLHTRYRASAGGLSANLQAMHDGWARALSSARSCGVQISKRQVRRAEAVHLRYLARRALRLSNAPAAAARLALSGMAKSPTAFLSNPYRGGATLLGCLSAPVMPRALRDRLFA